MLLTTFFGACVNQSPVSTTGYADFAELIAEKINQSDNDWINQHFDYSHIIEKATKGVEAPEYYRKGFEEGFYKVYTPGAIMNNALGYEGNIRFLFMKANTEKTALFRIVSENGLNYLEVDLTTDKEGNIAIKDFYSLTEGEWFSQGIKRLYIIHLAREVEEFSNPLADMAPLVDEVGELADEGKAAEAFDKLMNMPESVLDQKIILLILLNLGQDLGKEYLKKSTEFYKEKYPNDALPYLKEMEYAFLNQAPNTVVQQTIENLREQIGDDPYLKLLEGGNLNQAGQSEAALTTLEAAVSAEPDNDEFYWTLFDVLIQNKFYDKTIAYFQQFKKEFEENPADYLLYDGYKAFYQSKQYREWVRNNPLQGNPNLNIDSLINAVEEMMENGESPHNHDHDHNHHGHEH